MAQEISLSIAPTDGERASFEVHPIYGDPAHFESLLQRIGIFRRGLCANPRLARKIIMSYRIYLDPVVVTSVELYLWEHVDPIDNSFRQVVEKVGFPSGRALEEEQRKRQFLIPIDVVSFIKAILDASGVKNSLEATPSSDFLLSIRSERGDTQWYVDLIAPGY
ncbi:MAG: hypothetical protein WC483_00395 [Candidatus Paceibacterota bacterium]